MDEGARFGMRKGWRRKLLIVLCSSYICFVGIPSFASEPPATEWNLERIARSYPTPELIARVLQKWMTPADDQGLFGQTEYWQAPEEFLARRQGDCEDYALFTQTLLP